MFILLWLKWDAKQIAFKEAKLYAFEKSLSFFYTIYIVNLLVKE